MEERHQAMHCGQQQGTSSLPDGESQPSENHIAAITEGQQSTATRETKADSENKHACYCSIFQLAQQGCMTEQGQINP